MYIIAIALLVGFIITKIVISVQQIIQDYFNVTEDER